MGQLERDIIVERVKAGLTRAQQSGQQLERPKVNVDVREIRQLRSDGMSLRAIATQVGFSHTRVAQLHQSSS